MDVPARVMVYNQLLGLSGTHGLLVAVRREGLYELQLPSQGKIHSVLLPIAQTVLVYAEPEAETPVDMSIER